MDELTPLPVRPLSVTDLGIDVTEPEVAAASEAESTVETIEAPTEVEKLQANDPLLLDIRSALDMGFAGVILSGPPGTGKSYFAERVAHTIAGDANAVTVVQFHASYQYEDFMQGFAPIEGSGGFELVDKVFSLACKAAIARQKVQHVIVIDEISRCDVARVFGEALTYMEVDKRGKKFTLASGDPLVVPENLTILATMNPWDKGVDDLDVALERRFAQIDMPPDPVALRAMLDTAGADAAFADRVVAFFVAIQRIQDDMVHLGHAYFKNCVSEDAARRLWRFRLHPFFKKACRLDRDTLVQIERLWNRVVPPAAAVAPTEPAVPVTENVTTSDLVADGTAQAEAVQPT